MISNGTRDTEFAGSRLIIDKARNGAAHDGNCD
jgi:hypothetical protein